jgi:hypothetical protein
MKSVVVAGKANWKSVTPWPILERPCAKAVSITLKKKTRLYETFGARRSLDKLMLSVATRRVASGSKSATLDNHDVTRPQGRPHQVTPIHSIPGVQLYRKVPKDSFRLDGPCLRRPVVYATKIYLAWH